MSPEVLIRLENGMFFDVQPTVRVSVSENDMHPHRQDVIAGAQPRHSVFEIQNLNGALSYKGALFELS